MRAARAWTRSLLLAEPMVSGAPSPAPASSSGGVPNSLKDHHFLDEVSTLVVRHSGWLA